jgi:hypothetical protein
MRAAEWINLVFFCFFMGLAWLRPLAGRRRLKVSILGTVALSATLVVQWLYLILPPLAVSVIRDWLPAGLLLVAYWQAGQFFTRPNEAFQAQLLKFDAKLLKSVPKSGAALKVLRRLARYFEFAYLFCYVLVPFGLGVLYLMRIGRYADQLWATVLPSAYLCYLTLPFVQTLPPRMLEAELTPWVVEGKLRRLNLWILRHASIQANTFPSAHVAATVAASLALFRLLPWAGAVFLGMSISIAAGAVGGRYHYAADALLGAALAIAVFLLEAGFGR